MTIGDREKDRQLVGFILRLLRHSPEQAGFRMHADGWIDRKSLLNYLWQQQPETGHGTRSDLDAFLLLYNQHHRLTMVDAETR